MRRRPPSRLVGLNVPQASTATYASRPLPTAVIAGKAAQISSEMPAKISFFRPVVSIARNTRASSKAFAVDDFDSGQGVDQFRKRWAPHAVARRCRDDDRQLVQLGGFGEADRRPERASHPSGVL